MRYSLLGLLLILLGIIMISSSFTTSSIMAQTDAPNLTPDDSSSSNMNDILDTNNTDTEDESNSTASGQISKRQ